MQSGLATRQFPCLNRSKLVVVVVNSLEFCRKFCVIDDGSDIRWIVWVWCLSIVKRFEEFLAYFLYVYHFLLNFIFCVTVMQQMWNLAAPNLYAVFGDL